MSAASSSPRTPDAPMAFTRDEFWRGAMRAWGVFLLLLLALEVVAVVISDPLGLWSTAGSTLMLLLLVLVVSLLVGGAISGVSLVIGIPIARRIATALQHERRVKVHVIAFALYGFGFGALIGGGSYALAFVRGGSSIVQPVIFAALIAGALSAIAVSFAWWSVAREAVRADRGITRRTRRRIARIDPDAAVEDSR